MFFVSSCSATNPSAVAFPPTLAIPGKAPTSPSVGDVALPASKMDSAAVYTRGPSIIDRLTEAGTRVE